MRKNNPTAAASWYDFGPYDLEEWHHVEVYEYHPEAGAGGSDPGPVRIWLDGVEMTAGFDWYGLWSYYQGQIEYLRFYAIDFKDGVGEYYVDNLRFTQDAPVPPEGIIVYNSDGFEYFNTGNVDGQDIGRWSETTPGHAQIVDVNDIGGVHAGRGNALEFVPRTVGDTNTYDAILDLNWTGNFTVDPKPRDTAIKWEYDFYQEGSVGGGIRSNRNDNTVTQVQLMPQDGDFGVYLRKNSQDAAAAYETLSTYTMSQWHHVEVYQYQPDPESGMSRIKIWVDGVEVTAGNRRIGDCRSVRELAGTADRGRIGRAELCC